MKYQPLSSALLLALAWSLIPGIAAQTSAVPLMDNLGDHHYTITTAEPLAQRYFDQGLRLYYGFNHAEAIRAFEEGTRQDANCAMCYWGIALAYGPNINLPMDHTAALAAYAAMQKAFEREQHASAKERALIRALARRYAADPPEDRAALDAAYTQAMREFVTNYSDDLDGATLLAESLMDLSPWNYWTADGQPRENTEELLGQLERVMAASSQHPGANHFYIHAVEAVQPQRAVAAAERLAALMPGAGHIVHMPGHIYIRVGRYLDAIAANEHAVHTDEAYIRDRQPAPGMYTVGYYPHNYDFLAFAASMVGRSRQSISSAMKIQELLPPELIREPGMSFAQHHYTRHLQMKVRFARWDDILNAPEPPADFPHSRAMWSYARGRALAARGDVVGAERALDPVRATAGDEKLSAMRIEFNPSGPLLGIAVESLAGHIAAAKKDFRAAIAHLREAARREDALNYGEPPEWSIPVRQELGLVLLQAGQHAAAEAAFRDDLKRFPENGWSLSGLERALRAQDRAAEAEEVAARFRQAWSAADYTLPAAN